MRGMTAIMLAVLITPGVLAASERKQEENEDSLAQALNESDGVVATLSGCNGYWTWLSQAARAEGRDAAADYLKTFANGAQSSALWLLSARHQVDYPEEAPRTLGSFSPLVEGPAEIERLRMTALYEAGDMETITSAGDLCKAVAVASDPLIQSMRKSLIQPTPSPAP